MKAMSFATSVLLRFSAEKSQKKAKTTNFHAYLMFSKQRWMDAIILIRPNTIQVKELERQ